MTVMPFLRRSRARPTAAAVSQPASPAGLCARLVLAAIATLVVTNDARTGTPVATAIVALLVALTWWFVSFRDGQPRFPNMLAGSALFVLIKRAAALPDVPSLSNLVNEFYIGTTIYLLASFLLIRITLALPRVVAKARRRLAPG
jgi:hypothetical protein